MDKTLKTFFSPRFSNSCPKGLLVSKDFFFLKRLPNATWCVNIFPIFLSLTDHRESEVSSNKFKFLSLFEFKEKPKKSIFQIRQETDFPWETNILILSDFFQSKKWLMRETKILKIFGSFWNRCTNRPFLVSPWCMLNLACSVRLQSRTHGPNLTL